MSPGLIVFLVLASIFVIPIIIGFFGGLISKTRDAVSTSSFKEKTKGNNRILLTMGKLDDCNKESAVQILRSNEFSYKEKFACFQNLGLAYFEAGHRNPLGDHNWIKDRMLEMCVTNVSSFFEPWLDSVEFNDVYNSALLYYLYACFFYEPRIQYKNTIQENTSLNSKMAVFLDNAAEKGFSIENEEVQRAFNDAYSIYHCPWLLDKKDIFDETRKKKEEIKLRVETYASGKIKNIFNDYNRTEKPKTCGGFDEFEEQEINGHVIRFYPDPHRYTVDGKDVKTVTEVVKEWSKDNGYYEYYGVNPVVLERAARRGTALHKEIEDYETLGEYGHTQEFRNYLKVKRMFGFEICENEMFVYICNESGEPVCAGRLDFTCFLDGKFGLCDIKRTSKFHKEEVELQLNLYRLGYEQMHEGEIQFLRCLRLREDVMEFIPVKLNKTLAKKVIKDYCE